MSCLERNADALDLPVEIDARRFVYPAAHSLAKLLKVGGARSALIDEEIAVKLGNLRATYGKPPHAGLSRP